MKIRISRARGYPGLSLEAWAPQGLSWRLLAGPGSAHCLSLCCRLRGSLARLVWLQGHFPVPVGLTPSPLCQSRAESRVINQETTNTSSRREVTIHHVEERCPSCFVRIFGEIGSHPSLARCFVP